MAIPCRLGNLVSVLSCLAVSGRLAILLEPAYSTPVHHHQSQSPQTPVLALRLATTQRRRRTKIWEGGRGVGVAHFARSCSQDISGPFMGTGPGGAHATLSSVVVSLMLAYPHSSALDPCSSRFLFDCDLLPSHCGPQLSTLLVPPSLSLPLSVSLLHAMYLPTVS